MAQADYTKRSGKYRHIYGDLHKPQHQFLEIPAPLTSGEGPYVKASAKYFAFAGGSVQKLYVKPLSAVGRFSANECHIALDCLKGKIWDFSWNPFIDSMVAMGDDNGKVAVAHIPKDGLGDKNLTKAAVDLGQVHGKKVALVEFNPSGASILATGSFDRTVQLYNIETQSKIASYDKLGDNIYSLQWNENGSQLAVTGKDKKLRIFDPRNMEEDAMQIIDAFDGSKSSKVFWIPRLNWIGATGFSKQAKRELKLWDLRDTSKPVYSNKIDQASSVLMPHYDNDNGVLYLPGKGEGSVQFGEIINDNKKFYPLGAYRNPEPQKGGGWVPKRALDVWKCEVQRFLKLTSKAVRPISFIVPRKAGADVFQEDIYPDCLSAKPASTSEEWINGGNKDCNRMKMDPKLRNDDDGATEFVAKMTYTELEAENEKLRARVKELEGKLGITSDDDDQKEDADAQMATADDTAAADDDAAAADDDAAAE